MQKRKLAGGLVAMGVLVGAYFSGMFSKFGSGTGEGTGDGPGTGAKTVVASTKSSDGTTPAANSATKPATGDKATVDAAKTKKTANTPERRTMPDKFPLLEVYVRGHNYEVKDPTSADMLKVTLPEVILLAKRTTGDEGGLRVRVNRYRNARVVGWARVCEELERAGLKRETDYVMPHDMLEDTRAQASVAKPTTEKSK